MGTGSNLKRSNVISILGMHRSGTSYLSSCFEGLRTGALNNKHECKYIFLINEKLLKINGGSWDDPPDHIETTKELEKCRDEILGKIDIFKDPRTLLLLDFWGDLNYIGIFRHPTAVANSLKRRNNFSLEFGYRLWFIYNKKLLELKKDIPIYEFGKVKIDHPNFVDKFDKSKINSSTEGRVPNDVMSLYLDLSET